jgi:hypothetical protein
MNLKKFNPENNKESNGTQMTLMVMMNMIWNNGTRIRTDVADAHGLEQLARR